LDHPDGVAHGLGTMGWNAHMGKGFAWVTSEGVPPETAELLRQRYGAAYLYVTGPEDVVPPEIVEELGRYGLVRRIAGPDPVHTAVVNAGFKDFGRNFGWWVDWEPR